jgi:hypothetical protein
MQVTLNIPDELAAEAEAQGLSLKSYLMAKLANVKPDTGVRQMTVDEAIGRIRGLRNGNTLGDLRIQDLVDEGRRF